MSDQPISTKRRGPSIPGGGKRKNRDARKVKRRAEAEARQLRRVEEVDGAHVATSDDDPRPVDQQHRTIEREAS